MAQDPLVTKILGDIESMRIIGEDYPVLLSSNSINSIVEDNKLSLNLSVDIMQLLGMDTELVLNKFIEKIGDTGSGILDIIETAIKSALLFNLKGLYSCTSEPFIPDNLLDEYIESETISIENIINKENVDIDGIGKRYKGEGISIDLSAIDYTNSLRISPLNENIGNLFYFDRDFKYPSELYMSKDFNTFLWYVINNSASLDNINKQKLVWDNRYNGDFKVKKYFYDNPSYDELKDLIVGDVFYVFSEKKYKKIYHIYKDIKEVVYYDDDSVNEIIKCEFIEKDFPNSNVLKIHICGSTYGKKNVTSFNKTVFEFNADLLSSIKILEPKTFIGRLIGLIANSIPNEVNMTIDNILLREKIKKVVNKSLNSEITTIPDCFFEFSNEEYDELMQETELIYSGVHMKNDGSYASYDENALKELSNINNSNATFQENKITIEKTLQNLSVDSLTEGENKSRVSFNFFVNFFENFATVLVEEILSPKVQILLLINQYVSGKIESNNPFNIKIEDFLKVSFNIILSVMGELQKILDNFLYELIMEKLMPYITKYTKILEIEQMDIVNKLLMSYMSYFYDESNIDNISVNKINENVKNNPNDTC